MPICLIMYYCMAEGSGLDCEAFFLKGLDSEPIDVKRILTFGFFGLNQFHGNDFKVDAWVYWQLICRLIVY